MAAQNPRTRRKSIMANFDLDELERLAKAALPGPWEQVELEGKSLPYVFRQKESPDEIPSLVAETRQAIGNENETAAYIAAMHPSTTLALIERIRELQKINYQLEGFTYYKCRSCPNCGQHEIWCESYIDDNSKVKYQLTCRACRGNLAIGSTVEEAILNWNA